MAENTIPCTCDEKPLEVKAQETTREPERYITPPVDIYETKEGLSVVADLPGAAQDNLTISVEENILTIKAPVGEADESENVRTEYHLRNYFRQFELGEKIDQAGIQANYRNGVLKLALPFAEKAKPRRIDVKVA